MKKRLHGLKSRLFLYLLGFSLLLLVILWLFQTVFLDSFYRTIKRAQVESEATRIAAYIEADDWSGLEQVVLDRGDLYVEIWSPDGDSQTVPGNFPEGFPQLLAPHEKEALLEKTRGAGGALTTESETPRPAQGGGPSSNLPRGGFRTKMLRTLLLEDKAGGKLLLIVSADISPLNPTVETLQVQLVCISVLMLVLAVAIALLSARRVSRPIEKLTESAMELGRGNYDAPFNQTGYREIEELSSTLAGAAQELAKTDSLRRELVANVSHDLRTPLTLITGYSEMMRDIPGENTPENMQVVIDETKRLSGLVNDLLDLSQLESGTLPMHFERFDLAGAVRAIIERVKKLSEAEGHTISFEGGQQAEVLADEGRISQVVYNFLLNAMTHGGADKAVLVRQSLEDGRVRLEVTDRGAGIPPGQLAQIWDRYYQGDAGRQRSGAGLGLSIAKSILSRHPGAEYGAVSAPGQGSTFWFSLPAEGPEGPRLAS